MAETPEKRQVSRRDILKIGALAGVAAHAVAIPALGYKAGASKESYTGWESFEGETTQFFNRKPFEMSGGVDEMYEKFFPRTGEASRPNMMTDMPPVRQGRVMQAIEQHPDWQPGDGWADLELGPDLEAYYKAYEARGQDRFNDDVTVQTVNIPAWIANHETYDDHFALSLAYFGAWTEHAGTPPEITEPPEISDYQYDDHGHTVDLRDVNAERDKRDARLTFKSPEHAAKLIKKVAHLYGASVVGITTMNPDYCYTTIRGVGPFMSMSDSSGAGGAGPTRPTDAGAADEGDAGEGGGLTDAQKQDAAAALDAVGVDAEAVFGIVESSGGDPNAMMAAFEEAGIEMMDVMGALQAAGIDPMSLGGGGPSAGGPPAAMMQMEPAAVPEHWKFAIVIGVPHEWDQFVSNPQYGDSLDAYNRARMAGWRLANFLKRLGYASRWHTPPGSYDLLVTPFAVQAGLGQWGRMACVITPELGGNVRLAVVTTELEMEIDKPIDVGIADFCKDCKICAEICPSGSISMADTTEGMVSRGIEHWDINNSTCYGFWMESMGPIGCRLCLAACPYSRKDNWVHGMARVIDPIDPTGLVNDALIWMQKSLFDAPEAQAYKRPPDGCFASYRPAPEWLQTETWFDINPPDPHDLCR